jgi:hypothetical protein
MVDVSDPSSHKTQFPTDVGVNGAKYDIPTVFTLETVLLHMFSLAFRISVLPSNVILDCPIAALGPFAVRIFDVPVAPVMVVNPGPVLPVAPSTP